MSLFFPSFHFFIYVICIFSLLFLVSLHGYFKIKQYLFLKKAGFCFIDFSVVFMISIVLLYVLNFITYFFDSICSYFISFWRWKRRSLMLDKSFLIQAFIDIHVPSVVYLKFWYTVFHFHSVQTFSNYLYNFFIDSCVTKKCLLSFQIFENVKVTFMLIIFNWILLRSRYILWMI